VEEQKQDVLSENCLPEQAAAELKEMLDDVAREIAALDALRRTLLSGVIRQQSGLGVEEWLQAAESLKTLIQTLDQPGREETRRRQIITILAEWKEKLKRLGSCFQMAAQLAGNYVKNPGELTGSLDVLAHRQQVVRRLIDEIGQIEHKAAP
jgi:uncharacterized protein Yka (UPF0111/DUF47 family)